ncbi:hypothetical protein SAMN05660860_02289 [Geoalkalibacter ferrihydriticus]|uniref:Uncharacterized protein n=1 Tax=Geoalkalibacter ferrihydriticus TaxID=392333 RepID=A0A1G9S9S3_9BACT|nr:hypothetical protein [Geoalkalibacter ferrihydriticus]SDM32152.1 hypothetical protein SAMN05660860_02289 [Geoalkalibacter ferrihydriticus]
MYGVGILFSELAHETGGSMLDRILPVFLVAIAIAAVAVIYFALRKDKAGSSEDSPHED